MDMLRENSIKIQFRKTDKRPSSYELYRFLTDTVKLSMDAVCGIQLDNQKFSVVVKLALETRFRQILNTFTDDLLFAYSDGSTVPVKISDASAWTRAIKISGLPFELSDERLLAFLSAYGKVTTITHDLWQDEFFGSIENGDRTAVMDLKNSIPSKIQVDGHNGFVNYSGQQRTCHYCQVAGHFALSCPKKKSRQERMLATNASEEKSKPSGVPAPVVIQEPCIKSTFTPLYTARPSKVPLSNTPDVQDEVNIELDPTPLPQESDCDNYEISDVSEMIIEEEKCSNQLEFQLSKRRLSKNVSRSPSPRGKKKNISRPPN